MLVRLDSSEAATAGSLAGLASGAFRPSVADKCSQVRLICRACMVSLNGSEAMMCERPLSPYSAPSSAVGGILTIRGSHHVHFQTGTLKNFKADPSAFLLHPICKSGDSSSSCFCTHCFPPFVLPPEPPAYSVSNA